MPRQLITVAILAVTAIPTLFAVGCSSTNANAPYSLTGDSQAQIDQRHQEWAERQRFTDDKGRYRPDLAAANLPQR